MFSSDATIKLLYGFGCENWQDMQENYLKNEGLKSKPAVSKDWKEEMGKRLINLEQEISKTKQLVEKRINSNL